MSAFDAYYPTEVRKDLARRSPTMAVDESLIDLTEADKKNAAIELSRLKDMAKKARAAGGSSAHVDGRIKSIEAMLKRGKKKKVKEDGPMDPMGGMGGGAPAPAPAAPSGSAAQTFIKIAVDAVNFLSQKESDLSGMPSDSPELALVRSAEGLLKEYNPEASDDNKVVSSKVALLAKELRDLFDNGGNGEIVVYLRDFASKIDEFRATIDVGDAGEDMGMAPPEPEPEPAKPKKEAPPSTPQEREADLAKHLDLNLK